MANKVIMSWSKCKIEIGKTGIADAMAAELFSVGIISDRTTTLSSEDGDVLEAKATGGVIVATEEGEPTIKITTRVKEMDFETESKITGATKGENDLTVKSNVVGDDWSLKVTPKNIGAVGIKARKTHVSFRPGYSEEEGHYVDLTFTILVCEDGELYKKFKVTEADWQAAA